MLIRITDFPETFVPLGIRLLLRIFKNRIIFYDGSSKIRTLGLAKILLVVTKKMYSIGNAYPGRVLFLKCFFTRLQV